MLFLPHATAAVELLRRKAVDNNFRPHHGTAFGDSSAFSIFEEISYTFTLYASKNIHDLM